MARNSLTVSSTPPIVVGQLARVRGAVVVGGVVGATVATGAVVVGGVVAGGAVVTGALGATVADDEAGATDPPATDAVEPLGDGDDAAVDGRAAPVDPGVAAAVAPCDDEDAEPAPPAVAADPAVVSSSIDVGPVGAVCCALSASAATMVAVAARLIPAVIARDAGAE